MKKNVIIAILAITTILSTVYAFYEKTEAEKQQALAVENEKLAREMSIKAEEQMKLAEQQLRRTEVSMMEALKQTQIANEALKNCKKSN